VTQNGLILSHADIMHGSTPERLPLVNGVPR
jgi:hypothetical protein